MPTMLDRMLKQARTHPRLLAAGASSLIAAAGAVVARRRLGDGHELPDPAAFGAATAIAIHNATKGAVISAVRAAERADGRLVSDTVDGAMREAMRAGVDLAPAAVGVVEGAVEVAHVIGESPLSAGQRAAAAAVLAAQSLSEPAAERVRDVLAPYLEQRTDAPE